MIDEKVKEMYDWVVENICKKTKKEIFEMNGGSFLVYPHLIGNEKMWEYEHQIKLKNSDNYFIDYALSDDATGKEMENYINYCSIRSNISIDKIKELMKK